MAEGAFPSRCATILTLAAALCPLMIRPLIGADALTQHYNNARTGAVLDETKLTTKNVSSRSFGKLWTLYSDGQLVAQPLYVSALPVNTAGNTETPLVQGTFNAVFRNWDLADNYRVSPTITQFDRSADVLRP